MTTPAVASAAAHDAAHDADQQQDAKLSLEDISAELDLLHWRTLDRHGRPALESFHEITRRQAQALKQTVELFQMLLPHKDDFKAWLVVMAAKRKEPQ